MDRIAWPRELLFKKEIGVRHLKIKILDSRMTSRIIAPNVIQLSGVRESIAPLKAPVDNCITQR